jgi:phosphate transport system permease protein
MIFDRFHRRKIFSYAMTVLTGLAIVVILIPLVSVIYTAAVMGGPLFSLAFLTQNPPLPCTPRAGVSCPTGGIWPGIQGTFILVGVGSLIGVPIGLGSAIFAVEYGRARAFARLISTTADIMAGVPSILIGIFIFTVFLQYDPTIIFSATTVSIALGILMIPIVTRGAEEALRTVPNSVREAALALGIARWKISTRIVLVSALPGVITAILLSVARAAGESAILLILAGGTYRPFTNFNSPILGLPLLIFNFADSPAANWVALAWGAALFLIILILGISLISRFTLNRLARRMRGG